ncbi:MAG: EamA family transporter [Youngiibacter sp.]|jgi:multidrug transporter EmrE-like cation transporter|nr:EamA family transporter [Youngiibacter sp.]
MILKIIFYLFFSVGGLVLIKLGGNGNSLAINNNIVNISFSVPIILGLSFYVVSFLLWITILKEGELSYLFSMIQGISYICVMISSVVFLNEKFTAYKAAGVIVILVGILLINLGNPK